MFLSNTPAPFTPWSKGKLNGQLPPLKKQEIWSIRVRLQLADKIATWLHSTSLSAVNYVDVTSLNSVFVIFFPVASLPIAQWSRNRKPTNQSGLKLLNKREIPYRTG